ncbi:hypothetical protein K461DRAFT_90001 [Myriangium duriaei CBS 260.36]|uniref:Glutaredoxin domain-containing protein n=1 Tax=Myriangium duriaei CBS 260.36 TaxID=1168546 RepID=A0A9P4MR07_9PEZI|nr:hypothetical protein K461DRAFT_90001 [Myriangium duriaei CBS 260.36]
MRPATRSRLRPWLLILLALLTLIYLTTGSRSTQTSEFYTRTVAAMDARRKAGTPGAAAQMAAEAKVRDGQGEEIKFKEVPDHEGGKGEQVSHHKAGKQQVLEDEEEEEKDHEKAKKGGKSTGKKVVVEEEDEEEKKDAVHGPEVGGAGKKVKGKGDGDDGVARVGNTEKKEKQKGTKKGDAEVDALLDGILKKSPIIIFSKSYCPFSKKAKHILLDKYRIVPTPFVHEIDLMEEGKGDEPLGQRLQAKLFEMTKRRTVPNVLVNGVSIGGGDDIEALDENDALAEKLIEIGGKRIMEVKRVSKEKALKFKA